MGFLCPWVDLLSRRTRNRNCSVTVTSHALKRLNINETLDTKPMGKSGGYDPYLDTMSYEMSVRFYDGHLI